MNKNCKILYKLLYHILLYTMFNYIKQLFIICEEFLQKINPGLNEDFYDYTCIDEYGE